MTNCHGLQAVGAASTVDQLVVASSEMKEADSSDEKHERRVSPRHQEHPTAPARKLMQSFLPASTVRIPTSRTNKTITSSSPPPNIIYCTTCIITEQIGITSSAAGR